jgi:hypothetical protein
MADVYSVWNWKKGKFDYYRGKRARNYRERVGYPAQIGLKGVGDLPEESVNPIPAGAVYVGSGDQAVGVLASPTQRSGLLFVAAALVGLWWLW